ncbi:MAG: electron transfer flavoprotein subunit beta/FixA family protein [Tissierellia bacterium]|nr:electron transfer flavoprotein subunit beta/FixA family protein [Tissierellia bacterium]
MRRIIVCIKQVPETDKIGIKQEKGTLIRENIENIMNPYDKNALEEALIIKDKFDAEVIVITMGPPQAVDVLKEAISMGADEGVLINDEAFSGSDTLATSKVLAAAINKIADYSIIFCGQKAIDGGTAQVGPQIAELLNLPQVTNVKDIKIKGNKLEIVKATEDGAYLLETETPILLTTTTEINNPRSPTMMGINKAYGENGNKRISILSGKDLNINPKEVGLEGSPTNIYDFCMSKKSKTSEMIEGNKAKEKASILINKLSELNYI